VPKPGVEIAAADWIAWAVLWTCQPPRPTVVTSADAAGAARNATAPIANNAATALQVVD
jgi:hypothetical protein